MNKWRIATRALFALAAVAQMGWPARALAQAYPAKPIRMVLPSAAGSALDVVARIVAESLNKRLGVSVIVDNRPGASGILAPEAVARAAPDGYTLLFTQQDTQILVPILRKDVPYNAEKDFVALGRVTYMYLLFASHSKFPAKTVKELIDIAKLKPGGVKVASGGNGTIPHLMAELLKQRTGIELLHVPYKGGGAATTAVLSGEVDFFGGSPATLAKHIESGQLRGLAIAKETRSSLLPTVPTMAESGFSDFVVAAWFGLFGPTDLPDSVAAKLGENVLALSSAPEFQERMAVVGGEGTPLGPPAFAKFLSAESRRWREVIERAKIKLDE